MRTVGLAGLPLTRESREAVLHNDGIHGCVLARDKAGHARVLAYGPACDLEDRAAALKAHPQALAIWDRPDAVVRSGRTAHAVQLLDSGEAGTPYAAARAAGVRPEAVYRALKRREQRGTCPHCSQLLPTPKGVTA